MISMYKRNDDLNLYNYRDSRQERVDFYNFEPYNSKLGYNPVKIGGGEYNGE